MTELQPGGALRARMLARQISVSELADDLLVELTADPLHAWTVVDPDRLLSHAAALDGLSAAQRAARPLFGVPVAIKDNFDTVDLPTAYGSPIYAGHRPDADADAVAQLRQAGALIVGKTATSEFAWMSPAATVNPIDTRRTPGGSSSGSAAAVGAGTVPLATGSQTAGSINRPASYCGVFGLKPTFGRFSRTGIRMMAPSLDTAGLFAADLGDLTLAAAVLGRTWQPPQGALRKPRIALARTDLWHEVEPEAADAIEAWAEAARHRGVHLEDVELPGYAALAAAQETIQLVESAASLQPERAAQGSLLSDALRAAIDAGAAIPTERYEAARVTAATLRPGLMATLARFDAVLTPSATGVPPVGLSYTGDPQFCRVWTLTGAPSLSVPLAWTSAGLPVGLQLVAAPGADERLVSIAQCLV